MNRSGMNRSGGTDQGFWDTLTRTISRDILYLTIMACPVKYVHTIRPINILSYTPEVQ